MIRYLISLGVVGFACTGCSVDTFGGVDPDSGAPLDGQAEASSGDGGSPDAAAGDGDGDIHDDAALDASSDGSDGGKPPTKMRVFITSSVWNGNLGGLSGADNKCQSAASSASLGGKWMAWLSTSTNSPALRFTPSTVPYVLVNGIEIASDFAHLTGGFALEHVIDKDEFGVTPSFGGSDPNYVMTSTDSTGKPDLSQGTCSDYTNSTVAYSTIAGLYTSNAGQQWTLASEWYCNAEAALYCFEQ